MRAVRSGVYHIHFGPARPGLFSSQTYKSLGGGECDGTRICTYCTSGFGPQYLHTITLLLSRALAIARAQDVAYKWREGLGLECCARIHVFSCEQELAVK